MYITTYSCQCDECGKFESDTFISKSRYQILDGVDENGNSHYPVPMLWSIIHDKDFDPEAEYTYCTECFDKRIRRPMKEPEDMPETGEERMDSEDDNKKKKEYQQIVETQ